MINTSFMNSIVKNKMIWAFPIKKWVGLSALAIFSIPAEAPHTKNELRQLLLSLMQLKHYKNNKLNYNEK